MTHIRILLLCLGMCLSLAGVAAQENSFDILEYRVEGNKLLSVYQIEEAVYAHLGEKKSIDDVERARAALEKTYHDAGYLTVLVDIPEQSVNGGIVHLKVMEGSVGRVRVTGSRYYSMSRILSKVPELAAGNVPYFPALQKQLEAVNRPADLKIAPVLRPGKTPGTVEAELKVADKLPLHESLSLDNHRSANTTPLRLSGTVRYDNLWQKEHSVSLSFQTSPQNTSQVKVLSGTYVVPFNSGNQLAVYGVLSRSNVAAIGSMTVLGQGNILGARWVMPLPARETFQHSLTLGVDYKDFKDDTYLSGANTGRTPISYIPFSAGYNASLSEDGAVTNANATMNFKFRGLGDRMVFCNGQMTTQFECKRLNATPDYFYVRAGLDSTLELPRGLAFFARADGQIAGGPLISNEEFTAGGADSVRGYFEAEQAADDGLHATFELRGPQWAGKVSSRLNDLRSVVFVDEAHLRVREALPGQTSRFDLASAGFGVRLAAMNAFSMVLDVAWPLRASTYTPAGRPVVLFRTVIEN